MSFRAFNAAYQESVNDVVAFCSSEMQTEMARHNVAWDEGRIDFGEYLRRSSVRFFLAASSIYSANAATMCDIGGFWGVLPLTLKRLGLGQVSMTESLSYYGEAFTPLFDHLQRGGVTIHDYDPFSSTDGPPGRFDCLTLMAVLEHYPHSPKRAFQAIKSMMGDKGHLYVEVPNIAYLPKRVGLLRGHSPLSSIRDIWDSDEPFIGHHHEYTQAELRAVVSLSGLHVEAEWAYNYSTDRRLVWRDGFRALKGSLRGFAGALPYALVPSTRECISVLCCERSEDREHSAPSLTRELELGLWDVNVT